MGSLLFHIMKGLIMKEDKDKTLPIDPEPIVPDGGSWFWPIMVTVIMCTMFIGILLLFMQVFFPT